MNTESSVTTADETLAFFKLLCEADRLKIAGLLAQHAHTVDGLSTALALPIAGVSHHVARLVAYGLVSEASEGVYTFQSNVLSDLARRLLARAAPEPPAGAQDMDAFERKVLGDFFAADGRLKALPAQRKKVLPVLRHICQIFEPGAQYSEKQVNQMLARFHEDTASLRRGLVDYGFMSRQSGIYWRTEETDA